MIELKAPFAPAVVQELETPFVPVPAVIATIGPQKLKGSNHAKLILLDFLQPGYDPGCYLWFTELGTALAHDKT